jgi:hypothetical protein
MSDLLPTDDQQVASAPPPGPPGPPVPPGPPANVGPIPGLPVSEGPPSALSIDAVPVDSATTGVMPPYDSRYPPTDWVRPEAGSWEATLPAPAMQSWVGPSPMQAEPSPVAPAVETVTCPECGAPAAVAVNRRDAHDFCARCDYPLFWTPSRVLQGNSSGTNDMALRRLPGTVGRATIASRDCPHCAEPNTVTAQICVRCGLSMFPVAEVPVPVPVPVYVPPPPPPYEPPKSHVAWWVWVLLYLAVAATVVVVVLVLTHKIR